LETQKGHREISPQIGDTGAFLLPLMQPWTRRMLLAAFYASSKARHCLFAAKSNISQLMCPKTGGEFEKC
jgi:hypothetical protein